MKTERRSFLKQVTLGLTAIVTGACGPGDDGDSASAAENQQVGGNAHVDKDLHFLGRDTSKSPSTATGYYSSFYGAVFRLRESDPSHGRASFAVDGTEVDFSMRQVNDRTVYESVDGKYAFCWKPAFGFYALDPEYRDRIVELCPPENDMGPTKPDATLTTTLDLEGAFYSSWIRRIYQEQGVPRSPLPGLEGFADETLDMDASAHRDERVARGLNAFFSTLPFGLAALQEFVRVSPAAAVALLEKMIPQVFGWMLGPTENPERGKLVVLDCPFRNRLGTRPCESTCGHAIGSYFSKEVGIPLRFDPTVSNYRRCHILIGKDQNS